MNKCLAERKILKSYNSELVRTLPFASSSCLQPHLKLWKLLVMAWHMSCECPCGLHFSFEPWTDSVIQSAASNSCGKSVIIDLFRPLYYLEGVLTIVNDRTLQSSPLLFLSIPSLTSFTSYECGVIPFCVYSQRIIW